MSSFSLSGCLEKMGLRDKDFRYMALSDLLAELEKESFKMDNDSERKIVSALIKLLDDTSGDVQGLAVKCLGPLISKIKEQQIQEIVDTLADYVIQNKKETLRDIAGMGFKPVISQIDPKNAPLLVQRVTPKLITGINSGEKQVILECLSVLSDLLGRFATLMTSDHEKIQKAILPQLTSTRAATRKKAIACLGYLSISTPDDLFSQLVTFVLKGIKDSKKANNTRTLISVIGAISRSVGYRLGKFLESEQIIPLLIKYLNDEQFENDDELKENCFQTFESLVLRCPKEIKPYLESILKQCLKYLQWDPNMAADSGGESEEAEEFSGGDEEFSEQDFSDDEDMSWKVRRSSAKCLTSIINTRPDLLGDIYKKVIPTVVQRFKEREEPVKLDVFEIFGAGLKQSTVVSKGMSLSASDNPINMLKENVGPVVTNLTKELKSKSLKTKSGVFQLLKELVAVHPGLLSEHLGQLVPGIKEALDGKNTNSNLKFEVLTFLNLAIATHPPKAFHPYIGELSPPILKAVGDNYYKITAEALRVTRGLVRVIRPHEASDFDFKPYASKIYDAVFSKYEAQDIDQEVKESAIACVGSLIAHVGDELSEDLRKKALGILLDRLKNEITRLTSVNVLIEIATSPLNISLKAILSEAVSELADYLRQTSRQLKQACLRCLDVLVRNYSKDLNSKLFQKVLKEAGNLISDSDLHMSHLSLRLVEAIVRADKKSVKIVQSDIYPKILTLVQSSLLQGLALESLFSLYAILVSVNAKKFGFDELLSSLLSVQLKSSAQSTKQSQTSIAQCVAAICVSASAEKRDATVEKFVGDVKKSKNSPQKILALLCLAEIGRRVDLSSHKNIQKTILSAFDGSEDERNAASFCLGCVSVGNVSTFLPFVLSEIKSEPGKQYLLMHSLKEIITRASSSPGGTEALLPHLQPVLQLLFENTESEEEGTRNVVAECLGKFALISPKQLVPALKERIDSKSSHTRSTVVTAVKFAIVDKPHPVDDFLAPLMGTFLKLMADEDLFVRRATLLMLNYAAHNKSPLVRPVLQNHIANLYEETKVKKELIKIVDLGPFKHRLDTGLENRKAAFECMYTLLETCIDKIDINAFIEHIVEGLGDTYDIKLLCQLMLVRLANAAGPALLTSLDSLVEPFKKTITAKVKESAVQQEVEKNDELIRSALRAVAAIASIPDVDSAIKFSEFVKTTVKVGPYAQKYEEIVKQVQSGSA